MKKIAVLSIVGCCLSAAYFLVLWHNKKVSVQVFYDANIEQLPIQRLKNLRYEDTQEKNKLFAHFTSINSFDIKNICPKLNSIPQPNIVLWFTNHKGTIPYAGLEWYKKNVFDTCSQDATFWLTDLSAWKFFSLQQQELNACSGFLQVMEDIHNKRDMSIEQCALTNIRSPLFAQAQAFGDRYKALVAQQFFIWLSTFAEPISIMHPSPLSLIRNDLRTNAAHFTLREIGYTVPLLNYYSCEHKKNLLDLDQTQIFSLLQYLEAIYYTLIIIDNDIAQEKQNSTIVFLLPNKEFTYYLVENEKHFFQTFTENLLWFLKKKNREHIKVTLCFYPFSYGNSFYDQPYEEGGPVIKTDYELKNFL